MNEIPRHQLRLVKAPQTVPLTYPGTDTSATGGDFEVPVKILDGSSGEEPLHHQQDAIDKEGRCDSVDHVLEDVNPAGEE